MAQIACNYSDESQIIISDRLTNYCFVDKLRDAHWDSYMRDEDCRMNFWEFVEKILQISLDFSGFSNVVVIQCKTPESALLFKLRYL
jgi:hypothetical protein